MLGERHGSTMQVDDQGRRAIELLDLGFGHAVVPAVGVKGMERPALAQIKTLHDAGDEISRPFRAIFLGLTHQHPGWLDAVCLDVINLKSQALKANQVLNRQPDSACHGNVAHHAQQNDFLFGNYDHACSLSAAVD